MHFKRFAKTPRTHASQSFRQVLGSGRTNAGNFSLPAMWDKWDRDQTTLGNHPLLDLIEHISWSCLRFSHPRIAASQPSLRHSSSHESPSIRAPRKHHQRRRWRSSRLYLASPCCLLFRADLKWRVCGERVHTETAGKVRVTAHQSREIPPRSRGREVWVRGGAPSDNRPALQFGSYQSLLNFGSCVHFSISSCGASQGILQ